MINEPPVSAGAEPHPPVPNQPLFEPPRQFVESYWDWTREYDGPYVDVHTGRLIAVLRTVARRRNSLTALVDAAIIRIATAHRFVGASIALSEAFADLAVTGTAAFNQFRSDPPTNERLQRAVADALRAPFPAGFPRSLPDVTSAEIEEAVRLTLDRAYKVVWAIRGAPAERAARRPGLNWIAVSSEDDPVHAPVNASCTTDIMGYLQIRVPGVSQEFTCRAAFKLQPVPASVDVLGIPPRTLPVEAENEFLDLLRNGRGRDYDKLILFVHGLGSRLEEGEAFKIRLIEQGNSRRERYGILSVDLPGFGYSSRLDIDRLFAETNGGRPGAFDLRNPSQSRFPLLELYRDVLVAISVQIRGGFQYVVGGSLGGNLGLWLIERGSDGEHRLKSTLKRVFSWSPASVWESYERSRTAPHDVDSKLGMNLNLVKDGAKNRPRDRMLEREATDSRHKWFELLQRGEQFIFRWGHWGTATPSSLVEFAEIYDEGWRRTLWVASFEQTIFSHRENISNGEWPFRTIDRPLLIASGSEDNGDAGDFDLFNFYTNVEKITNESTHVPGRRLLVLGLGHSMHEERPLFMASRAAAFFVDRRFNSWRLMPVAARAIGSGGNGSTWVIGTDPAPGGFGIHRWTGAEWQQVDGGAVRIAVARDGMPWVVNDRREIFQRTSSGWQLMPGAATDIACSPSGSIWHIGITPTPGGFGIWRWNSREWVQVDGGALRIAVDSNGDPWVVNDAGQVFKRRTGWVLLRGTASAIGAAPNSHGSVWSIGTARRAGGFEISHFAGGSWMPVDGAAVEISVDREGAPWVVNDRGQIFRRE